MQLVRLICLAPLALGACAPASTDYPIIVGGGGGMGGGQGMDGGTTTDGPVDLLLGRVCLLDDLRDFSSCDTSAAGNITVSLPGVPSATTIADGGFQIQVPNGSNLVWSLSGASIVSSTYGFGISTQIPAIAQPAFDTLYANNGVLEDESSGAIFGQVFQANVPAVGATVASTPEGSYPVFYASTSDPDVWSANATTTFGSFWLPGLQPGAVSLAFLGSGAGSAEIDAGQTVGSNAVTFVTFGL